MRNCSGLILAAACLAGAATAADAAAKVIYRVSGVMDDGGGSNLGAATVFTCTNYGKGPATITIKLYSAEGAIAATMSLSVTPRATVNFSTHETLAFIDNQIANAGAIKQGSAKILSTSLKVGCSAFGVPADAILPQGTSLHLSRFNQAKGQQD